MKKIAVCYKWVLSDTDIRVNEKTRELDMEKTKPQVSEYDRNSLAAGVALKAAAGASEIVGVTCGTAAESSSKDALSRGPDAVYFLDDPVMASADSTTTAKVLAGMIKNIQDVDVVICSEASSDEFAQQTGPRLAALLGYPSVTGVSAIAADGDCLTLDRKMADGTEVVSLKVPVVISTVPEIKEAPIPSVKDILGAKKKPSNALTLAGIGLSAEAAKPLFAINSVLAPESKRKVVCMNPEGISIDDAAKALIKQLASDGIL
ncbi:MAG: electron transfer flavoprotein subunit beta/FixA family protein [Desulfovibrio sp.]|jgi:electron transfer flavoprotein beta subunit|nr:electron transfer flavoprotein subunit beta/FixA family protein [Desulfovibrio sp.]